MARRSEITIFLIWQDHVLRADFVGRKRVLQHLAHAGIGPDASLEDAILAPQSNLLIGRHTLVLSTQLWMQMIQMPSSGIDSLPEEELDSALRYEIESLCGIEADQSQIGYREISSQGGDSRFQVVAARRDEFATLTRRLNSLGATRVELCHPAGTNLAKPDPNRSGGASSRQIQVWPGLATYFDQAEIRGISMAARDPDRWAQDFLIESDTVHSMLATALIGDGPAGPNESGEFSNIGIQLLSGGWPGNDETQLELSDPRWSLIRSWFEQVACEFERGLAPAVIVRKRARASAGNRLLLKTALAVAAIGCCWLHWSWLQNQQTAAVLEYEQVKQPGLDKQLHDRITKSVQEKRQQLVEESSLAQEQLRRVSSLVEIQSDRLVKLLDLTVRCHTDDLRVDRIRPNELGLVISGISLNSESPQDFANKMRPETEVLGWKVNPATLTGQRKMTSGGPWNFEIQLQDTEPSSRVETASLNGELQ